MWFVYGLAVMSEISVGVKPVGLTGSIDELFLRE